jgi:hypothetical protein
MKLRETISLVSGAYHASLALISLTQEEDLARSQYGSWAVDTGGQFDDGVLTFDLPTDIRMFPEQFPRKKIFDTLDYEDAEGRAGLWLSTVRNRLVTARDTALSRDPGTIFDQVNEYTFEA